MAFMLSLGDFYGFDSLIELLIVIVSFIISFYSHKVYKLIKEDNYRYFSLSFLFIGISFIFKILSDLTVLHKAVIQYYNFVFVVWKQLEFLQQINFFSFILYKIFNLIGFLILFLIVTKTNKKEKVFMFFYMSFITVLFSIYFNFIFNVTLVFILVFLTEHFYQNYRNIKSLNSKLVLIAFVIILISHLFFIFVGIHGFFYLFGEILILFGFLFLLFNHIILNRKVKNYNVSKKNKIGGNTRHFRRITKK